MEFVGIVSKVLPVRSGTSQRTGNEWRSLPFIFEYYENDNDRYADSVVLETFDEKVIPHLKEGMEIRCGWGHKARTITKSDGTTATFNELRLYKIESIKKAKQQEAQAQTVAPQQPPQAPPPTEEEQDDLPF